MIGNIFAPLAMKIATGIAVALALFAGAQTWRLSAAQGALEDKREELAACEARHAVTRGSVARLEAEFARVMRAAAERASEFEAAKLEAERDAERLRGAAKESDARIARLRTMAQRPSDGRCEAPGELLRELEGL